MIRKIAAFLAFIYIFSFAAFAETKYTLTLSASYIKLDPGDTQKLVCTVTPQNLTEHTFTWSSENPYVASVSEKGTITAHAAGTTRVYCTIETGAVKYATVAVTGNPVRSLSITDNDIELEIGESAALEYSIDQTADDQRVKWSSSDESVATVSSAGVVKAISGGTAVITLTAVNGLTATADVYVPSDVKRIEIEPAETYVGIGSTVQLDAYVFPGNARDRELTWLSSNEAIATVDQNGNVTAVSEGVCMIKASAINGAYAIATVSVSRLPVSIEFTKKNVVLSKDDRYTQLTTVCSPSDAQDCALTWESSDTAVVSVSNGYLTANGYGTATVTATALNGVKAECTVYVCEAPTAVSFDKSSYTIPLDGSPVSVSISFEPDNSMESGAVYRTDDASIATISSSGLLTPVAPGSCNITVTLPSGISASARVTVYENATELFLRSDHIYMYAGTVQELNVYTDSGNLYTSALTSTSDSASVAFYSSGYIFAKSEGTALITLRSVSGNLSCSLAVTVYPNAYTTAKSVALTFDNGPSENTASIIAILEKYDITATFFLLGKSVENAPAAAMQLADTEYEIGNHTYSNISVSSSTVSEVAAEIEKADKLIQNAVGRKATLLRAPDARLSASLFGTFLDTRRYVARGIETTASDAETAVDQLLSACFDTAVITLQEGAANTPELLDMLVPKLMQQGYSFVTVSELIELTGSTDDVFSTSK